MSLDHEVLLYIFLLVAKMILESIVYHNVAVLLIHFGFQECKGIEVMLSDIAYENTTIICTMTRIFENNFVTTKTPGKKTETVTIKINKNTDDINSVLSSFFLMGGPIDLLDCFGAFLRDNICMAILNKAAEVKSLDNKPDGFNILSLTYSNTVHEHLGYSDVFKQLSAVFEFLSSSLNFSLDGDLTVMKYLGNQLCNDLSEQIIASCLSRTIPTSPEAFQQYSEVSILDI